MVHISLWLSCQHRDSLFTLRAVNQSFWFCTWYDILCSRIQLGSEIARYFFALEIEKLRKAMLNKRIKGKKKKKRKQNNTNMRSQTEEMNNTETRSGKMNIIQRKNTTCLWKNVHSLKFLCSWIHPITMQRGFDLRCPPLHRASRCPNTKFDY